MKVTLCNSVLKEVSLGCALHEIIYDKDGLPVDFRFLDANPAYENISGHKNSEIIGKTMGELNNSFDKSIFEPVSFYYNIAFNKGNEIIERYSELRGLWFRILVFSDKKDTFITVFTDISEQKHGVISADELLNLSRTLLDSGSEDMNYHHLTEVMCRLSGSKYAVLNLYSDDGTKFRNAAIYGHQDILNKAYKLLGFNLKNREWDISELRLVELENSSPVRFSNLSALAEGVLPDILCRKISKTFNLGNIYVVEIKGKNKIIGDFILLFEKNKEIMNSSSVTAYSNMAGIGIERRKGENRILASEDNLKNFFNAGIDFHWVLDRKGKIIAVNEIIKKRLEYTEDELIGKTVLNVHPAELRTEAERIIGLMLKGEEVCCNIPLVSKSGNQIPVETCVIKGTWDGSPALFGVSRDISALKISEEKFFRVFNTSPAIIGLSTLDTGVYVEVNQSFYDILGFAPKDVIGKRSTDVIWLDEYYRAPLLMKLKDKGFVRNEEAIVYTKDKKPVYVQLSAEIIKIQEISYILTVAIDISERKEYEDSLKKSEDKYKSITERMSDVLWTCNLEMNLNYISPSLERILGFTPDERIYMSVFDQITPESIRCVNEILSEELKNDNLREPGRQRIVIIQFYHRDGTVRAMESAISFIRDEKGKPVGIQGLSRDITERRLAEEILRESEANLTAVIENTLENIWSVNRNYEIQYVNEVFASSFRQTFGTLLKPGVNIIDALPDFLKPIWKERYDRALKNEHYIFEDKIDINDTSIYIEVAMNPIVIDGTVVGISAYGKDVTEKKHGQIQLQYQSDLRKLLVELSSGFINLPLKEINYAINQSLERIGEFVGADRAYVFSYDFQEFTATNTLEWCRSGVIPQIGNLQNISLNEYSEIASVHQQGEIVKVDNVCDLPHGNMRTLMEMQDVISLLTLPMTKEGACVGFVGFDSVRTKHIYTLYEQELLQVYAQTLVNAMERIEKEEKLVAAKEKAEESDRLKSAFLANMSHEIRTPMNGIIGFLNLLNEPDLSDENKAAYINIVTESGHRLLDTINDIIEISKIESGALQVNISTINVPELIGYYNGFFRQQTDQKGLQYIISNRLPVHIQYFRSDRNKLDSVLSNLIKNAIKFTSSGSVGFGCYLEESKIVFYVKDTGTGIPEERLNVIFDRFVQGDLSGSRQHEGSGLGLAIVKAYTGMLNGSIRVQSQVGKGSTFIFSIPFLPDDKPIIKSDLIATKQVSVRSGIKILIAEDDFASYLYLEKLLTGRGITFLHTVNGEETVERVRANPDISIILMDIKMPGMTGLEATRLIRQFNKTVPVIAQTAYSLAGDRELAIEAGCNDYISKPVDSSDLRKMVIKYTGMAAEESSAQ